MQPEFEVGLVWFRRDLRSHDNTALTLALNSCSRVYCAFVFDRAILDALPRADRRVEFIRESLVELDISLREVANRRDAGLIVRHGFAHEIIPEISAALGVQAVFAAHDYEVAARVRDGLVSESLTRLQIAWRTVKDHVIFERREILTLSGTPYTVFTPYKRAWLARLGGQAPYPMERQSPTPVLAARPPAFRSPVPELSELGFLPTNLRTIGVVPGMQGGASLVKDFLARIDGYDQTRDYPGIKGPSYLSVHLRFGTVSIRQLVALAMERVAAGSVGAAVWLSELIWRDFYFQILANFPDLGDGAFRPEYDHIIWEAPGGLSDDLFRAWCAGETGYPLVDAAMRQLNQTGYMHNRLRMVAGSFLVKHLGIDWRWGERYFAQNLNDFDLAANNGGWQWVSSSGCDAQPYFRIFNPIAQSQKFDAQGKFIKRYVPQLANLAANLIHAPWLAKVEDLSRANIRLGHNYPHPIVDHAQARAKTLARYAVVRKVSQAATVAAQ